MPEPVHICRTISDSKNDWAGEIVLSIYPRKGKYELVAFNILNDTMFVINNIFVSRTTAIKDLYAICRCILDKVQLVFVNCSSSRDVLFSYKTPKEIEFTCDSFEQRIIQCTKFKRFQPYTDYKGVVNIKGF